MKNSLRSPLSALRSPLSSRIFVLLLLIPGFLSAQSLFSVHNPNSVNLSQEASDRYDYLSSDSFISEIYLVSTNDLRDLQEDGILTFQLPGRTDTLIAEADLIDENTNIGFRWSGRLINVPGYITFDIREGLTAGYLLTGPDFYQLIPADSNYQFLVKSLSGIGEDCGNSENVEIELPPDTTTDPPDQCEYAPDHDDCPALITVLVIVTPEAEAELAGSWGGLDFFVRFGEAMVNQAFYNSDITNKEIRVKYIQRSGFEFDPDQDFNEDLLNLETWSETDREDYNADLVVLLNGETYDESGGVASLSGAPAFDKAFAIVEAQWYLSFGAFCHEVGHLFGCRHNWTARLGDDDAEVCAHAQRNFIFVEPPFGDYAIYSWRTLVGRPFLVNEVILTDEKDESHVYEWHESWILHYSNPEISYDGVPTGEDEGWVSDNAQQIRNTGCDIADFYPAQELSVFASYNSEECEDRTFTADIVSPESGLPGVAPYTVSWYWNNTGVFNYPGQSAQLLGTGPTITVSDPNCPIYYVKCVVVSRDLVQVSRIIKVILDPLCCDEETGEGGDNGKLGIGGGSIRNKHIRIYPNPLAERIVYFEQGYEPASSFELLDQHSRILLHDNIAFDKGHSAKIIPVGKWFAKSGHILTL